MNLLIQWDRFIHRKHQIVLINEINQIKPEEIYFPYVNGDWKNKNLV